MLRNLQDLEGTVVEATDGEVGRVKDFYFDHHSWALRYLTVETGSWFTSRQVLLSPRSFGTPDWGRHRLPVRATRAQVRDSPAVDLALPISRQFEVQHGAYYGYPYYWEGSAQWGGLSYPDGMYPDMPGAAGVSAPTDADLQAEDDYRVAYAKRHGWEDLHVRSFEEIRGFRVHASDGELGTLDDVLIDDRSWAVRYLVIGAGHWWNGERLQVVPQWIDRIDWGTMELFMGQTRQEILDAPVTPADAPGAPPVPPILTAAAAAHAAPGAADGRRSPS